MATQPQVESDMKQNEELPEPTTTGSQLTAPNLSIEVDRDAQLAAITEWGIPDESRLNRLAGITQPTFVANGDNDEMMHTANSVLLADKLPNSQLRIYPDAKHGFLYQYPELFADHVRTFLSD